MEAIFDNKANVLNAKVHATHDNSVIYSISTDQTLWGRTYTYVKDTNPALGGESTIVGVINWGQKTFEIQGNRKPIKDIRRKPGGFRNKSRFWKWAEGREEYDIVHHEEGWQATCTSTGVVEATLSVPYRPQLFGKPHPVVLNLSQVALAKDEVILILALIYGETKRQEKTNSSGGCFWTVQPFIYLYISIHRTVI
ncbi:hypothetical protein BDZ97DRAFT_986872 [Flammula alnicola]|nr:hypothetical protein BDZ97DRAFT_986872 [Flammula alnicola]